MATPELPPELARFMQPYIEESNRILAMPEPQRTQYVTQVILSLAVAIKKIAETQGLLNKKRKLEKLIGEWMQKSPKLLPPLIYSIKPEFREAYLPILEALSQINK
jgi:hypothetical protein